jgi:hypothetical protein
MYREIIIGCSSGSCKTLKHALWKQRTIFFIVKLGSIESYHWALKG